MIKQSIDKDGKVEMEKIHEVVYFKRWRIIEIIEYIMNFDINLKIEQ